MKAEGKGASEIAKALKIGRASVYRVLEAGWSAASDAPDVVTRFVSVA
jgi:DNA invertase Pin-like site-specific DNA recombinase